MSQIINAQKIAEKDINNLWKAYRLLKSMVYGTHNRFVVKVETALKKHDIEIDFSNIFLEDKDD